MSNCFVTKDFLITDILSFFGDVAKSFLYSGSLVAFRTVGLMAVWWLAGWCFVKLDSVCLVSSSTKIVVWYSTCILAVWPVLVSYWH